MKALSLIVGLIVGALGVFLSVYVPEANKAPVVEKEMASIEDVKVALTQRDAALEGLARAIKKTMVRIEELEKKKK